MSHDATPETSTWTNSVLINNRGKRGAKRRRRADKCVCGQVGQGHEGINGTREEEGAMRKAVYRDGRE